MALVCATSTIVQARPGIDDVIKDALSIFKSVFKDIGNQFEDWGDDFGNKMDKWAEGIEDDFENFADDGDLEELLQFFNDSFGQ